MTAVKCASVDDCGLAPLNQSSPSRDENHTMLLYNHSFLSLSICLSGRQQKGEGDKDHISDLYTVSIMSNLVQYHLQMKTNTTGINDWHLQISKYTAYALYMAVTCILHLKLTRQTDFKLREEKTSAR